MNGAEAALRTLAAGGVSVCFANPGTSEMHTVAALDAVTDVRGVLGLFEGVVTGAADGYGRMAGRPAATLLHLGPGLANGLANLHNAAKARTGIVNLVGDHAGHHKYLDAPLESNIDAFAATVSTWVRTPRRAEDVGAAVAGAVTAASSAPGEIATVILRADAAWSEGGRTVAPAPGAGPRPVPGDVVDHVAKALRAAPRAAILLGGDVLSERGLAAAARIAGATGVVMHTETFPARVARGAGRLCVERLGYFAEQATAQLAGISTLVLAGASEPVSFFAYPGRPNKMAPPEAEVVTLSRPGEDGVAAIEALAGMFAGSAALPPPPPLPDAPDGALDTFTVAAAVARTLPEEAIVVDEAISNGPFLSAATAGSAPHDWLALTGGAIGDGLPTAVGAAIACPERRVVALQADGSAMYTIQSLWTMAREQLDVTVLLLSNHRYAILGIEMDRVGAAGDGSRSRPLLSIGDPAIDAVALSRGFGVPAQRATDAAHLTSLLEGSYSTPGPMLIEVEL